ncbi:MAG: DNA adenine methylase [Veillonella sp.]|nr:DNA adenine methylase [Veillonella sp.]MDU6269143.1 DNA adenine methylase [Veillonella sp.]MDU6275019.1 DNA adenine methylase [Veillonella sp.]
MPRTKSILRYPGGKTQLSEFVNHLIQINNIQSPIYCEPFSGGSGVSIELLLSNRVNSIILNDYDPAIYSV